MGFGRLEEAEIDGASASSGRGIGKKPCLSPPGQGPDRVLGQNVAEAQDPILTVADQLRPLVQRIVDGLAGEPPFSQLRSVSFQPGVEGVK